MRELERRSLSMLWEKPSYDDDAADALDLEQVECCAVREQMSSLERHGSAKEYSQRASRQIHDLRRTDDGNTRLSPSSDKERQLGS